MSNSHLNRDIDTVMKVILYRQDCPDPYILGEYPFHHLPEEVNRQIEEHLEICPHCEEELQYLEEFMENDIKFDLTTVEKAKKPEKIIPFRQNSTRYDPVFLKTGIRGSREDEVSGKIIITMDRGESCDFFFRIMQENGQFTLAGQFNVGRWLKSRIVDALVEIWQHNTIFTTTSVDEFYSFKCRIGDFSPVLIRIITKEGILLCFTIQLP